MSRSAHGRSLATLLALSCVAGCVDRPVAGGETAAPESSTDEGESSTGESEGDEGGEALPAGFCEDACATLDQGSCLTQDSCIDYCEAEFGAWSVDYGEAFASCAGGNPLCYQSVEGCVFNVLHPPQTSFPLQLSGAGLELHEGQTVYVTSNPNAALVLEGAAEITDGAFSLEWFEPIMTWEINGPLLYIYIDVDADAGCDPDVDRTASLELEWNGDHVEPAFEAFMSATLGPSAFICDYVP